jgi:hypothetical protein
MRCRTGANPPQEGERRITSATPALDLWRLGLVPGRRAPVTFDRVWRAACEEMNAQEALDLGLPALAEKCRAKAHGAILNPGAP